MNGLPSQSHLCKNIALLELPPPGPKEWRAPPEDLVSQVSRAVELHGLELTLTALQITHSTLRRLLRRGRIHPALLKRLPGNCEWLLGRAQ